MEQLAITERDIQQMLSITRRYEDDGGEALPWELLRDLKDLVPCELLEASGQDTPRWDFFAEQQLPDEEATGETDVDAVALYREKYWQSACSYPDRSGDITSVVRVSDLISRREHHNSALYVELGIPAGTEHELMVCLDAGGPQRTLRLLFNRGPGSDFSARDVAVLTLLRPHLQAAYLAAERRRRGQLPLTVRQQEILQFVAAGYTNRQIARQLRISEATVRTHLENIFSRLEVNSRTAAVARLNAS
jgi:DNA-binding CsgD family transcriptional regulator